jgi:hypothetical protein
MAAAAVVIYLKKEVMRDEGVTQFACLARDPACTGGELVIR